MFLLPRAPTILGAGLGLGLSFSLYPSSPFRSASSRIQFQYSAPYYRSGSQIPSETGWAVDPNDPAILKQGRTHTTASRSSKWLTPRMMRQASLGSVLGLIVGVGLRAFSSVFTVALGMGIVFVEWAASKGYNLIPVNFIQRFVSNVDVQRAVSENMPFKVSFGTTLALAAFAHFRESS